MEAIINGFSTFIAFLKITEKLKKIKRYKKQRGRFKESVPDHCWRAVAMAIDLFNRYQLQSQLGFQKVVTMIVFHDLQEAICDDIDQNQVFSGKITAEHKHEVESQAWDEIIRLCDGDELIKQYRAVWDEFEANETSEANFANAIDALEALWHVIQDPARKFRVVKSLPHYADLAVMKCPVLLPFLMETKKALRQWFLDRGYRWRDEYDQVHG